MTETDGPNVEVAQVADYATDRPTATFHDLINQWLISIDSNGVTGRASYKLGEDCSKSRLVSGTIVVDIYWYPISNDTHRDWYTVDINSIRDSVNFIGSLDEFGRSKYAFAQILEFAEITTNSKAVTTTN